MRGVAALPKASTRPLQRTLDRRASGLFSWRGVARDISENQRWQPVEHETGSGPKPDRKAVPIWVEDSDWRPCAFQVIPRNEKVKPDENGHEDTKRDNCWWQMAEYVLPTDPTRKVD